MNESKYSKAKALGHMTKAGTKRFLTLLADPYYSSSKNKNDNSVLPLFGPMVRNATAFAGIEAIKTILTGKPPEGIEYLIGGCGGIVEGGFEVWEPVTDMFAGTYDSIKESWRKAKSYARIRFTL